MRILLSVLSFFLFPCSSSLAIKTPEGGAIGYQNFAWAPTSQAI